MLNDFVFKFLKIGVRIAFQNQTKTFLDPSCGDGQFLGEVLIRKLENGIDFETALSTIYGVDLMQDNVKLCQDRLLCGQEQLRHAPQSISTNPIAAGGSTKIDGALVLS